jgi:hypothetical protein
MCEESRSLSYYQEGTQIQLLGTKRETGPSDRISNGNGENYITEVKQTALSPQL